MGKTHRKSGVADPLVTGSDQPDDRDRTRRWTGSPLLLAGALASWLPVVIAPWLAVGIAAVVLAFGASRLRIESSDRLVKAAVAIALLALVTGLVFALLLIETSATVVDGPPVPD